MPYQVSCKICGAEFQAKQQKQNKCLDCKKHLKSKKFAGGIKKTCSICNKEFFATRQIHTRCDECLKEIKSNPPTCKCGCGTVMNWKGGPKTGSFRDYAWGHRLKDENEENPRHSPNYGEPYNKGNRKYTSTCKVCGKEIRSSYRKEYCNPDCQYIGMKGHDGWSKGLTAETDERLRKIGEKVSKVRAEKIASGEDQTAWFKNTKKGYMLNKSTGEEELFRSSYEAAYMHILNELSVKWTTKHGIIVNWKDSAGKSHRYVPDFLIKYDDREEIHEIKNSYSKHLESNKRKFHAAIRKGLRERFDFKVFDEKDFPVFHKYNPENSKYFINYID